VAKAPRGQSFNSGVGHKTTPRFSCGDTCATDLPSGAITDLSPGIIFEYFKTLRETTASGRRSLYYLALVGTQETLASDLGEIYDSLGSHIQHLQKGNPYYDNAPQSVKAEIEKINSKNLTFKINGQLKQHIVGLVSIRDFGKLTRKMFGFNFNLPSGHRIPVFGDGGGQCTLATKGLVNLPGEIFCPRQNAYVDWAVDNLDDGIPDGNYGFLQAWGWTQGASSMLCAVPPTNSSAPNCNLKSNQVVWYMTLRSTDPQGTLSLAQKKSFESILTGPSKKVLYQGPSRVSDPCDKEEPGSCIYNHTYYVIAGTGIAHKNNASEAKTSLLWLESGFVSTN
jgi:hypothetical protein